MLAEVRRPVQRVHYMNKIVVEHVAVACFIVYSAGRHVST